MITCIQEKRWSALHFAAERGDVGITSALLKAGANMFLRDKVSLHRSCDFGHVTPQMIALQHLYSQFKIETLLVHLPASW